MGCGWLGQGQKKMARERVSSVERPGVRGGEGDEGGGEIEIEGKGDIGC